MMNEPEKTRVDIFFSENCHLFWKHQNRKETLEKSITFFNAKIFFFHSEKIFVKDVGIIKGMSF